MNYPYNVQKTKVLDNEVAYIDEGNQEAETLVFVHGLGSYLMVWRKNIALLSLKYRCIALDLPGYGFSDKRHYEFDLDFYSNLVGQFINQLNLKKVTLIGHSMGGQISMITALKFPNLLQNLCLVATAGFEKFNSFQKSWLINASSAENLKLLTRKRIALNMTNNFKNVPDDVLYLVKDTVEFTFDNFERYCYTISSNVRSMIEMPVYSQLSKIQTPTLVIFGEDDALIPNRLFSFSST
ncbi:MAG: alpha/beta fold hydrolase, partial [Saprospiraceae bacterium]